MIDNYYNFLIIKKYTTLLKDKKNDLNIQDIVFFIITQARIQSYKIYGIVGGNVWSVYRFTCITCIM